MCAIFRNHIIAYIFISTATVGVTTTILNPVLFTLDNANASTDSGNILQITVIYN